MANKNSLSVIMAEFADVRFDARVLKSAQALSRAGYQVDLLMYNASIKRNTRRVENNLIYHEFAFIGKNKTTSFIDRYLRLLRGWLIILKINIWILSHRADVYHAHNLFFLWSSVIMSRLFKAKVVYDAHELHSEAFDKIKIKGLIIDLFSEFYERFLLPHYSAFIQASDERADFISLKYHIPKPYVINNNVPLVPYNGKTNRIQRECNLPSDSVILFYAGGIYKDGQRRIDVIISALPKLDNVHLVILGFMHEDIQNRLLEMAEELSVGERIHVLPPCSPEEIYDYAASADIGVIPISGNSVNIRMSALNKISEYLMAGLPIASSSYPNLVSIIQNNPIGPVGATFDISSADSIADTIRSILARRAREHFSENARQLAVTSFNWEAEEQKLLAIYRQVCASF
jgi:glycosyltransferase involved in cell wall biosynthesis